MSEFEWETIMEVPVDGAGQLDLFSWAKWFEDEAAENVKNPAHRVYIMQGGGFVKVGISIDVETRFQKIGPREQLDRPRKGVQPLSMRVQIKVFHLQILKPGGRGRGVSFGESSRGQWGIGRTWRDGDGRGPSTWIGFGRRWS